MRCPYWGLKGLNTEILPSVPVTSACIRKMDEENIEQPMCAVPPSESEKRASMARSTPGDDSLASAPMTRGPGARRRSRLTG